MIEFDEMSLTSIFEGILKIYNAVRMIAYGKYACPKIRTVSPGRPARGLVTVLTELPRPVKWVLLLIFLYFVHPLHA
jgi:hypothetical protein